MSLWEALEASDRVSYDGETNRPAWTDTEALGGDDGTFVYRHAGFSS